MRWHSESWPTKLERMEQWHRWFAWHPIRIGESAFWLEYVERRGQFVSAGMDCEWQFEYREAA